MNRSKRDRLRKSGWAIGSVADFLGLTKVEEALVELKLTLSRRLKEKRSRNRMSQGQLAKVLGSSQSRVAKMEAGDPSVSIDLLVRSLLAMGTTRKELAEVIAQTGR